MDETLTGNLSRIESAARGLAAASFVRVNAERAVEGCRFDLAAAERQLSDACREYDEKEKALRAVMEMGA